MPTALPGDCLAAETLVAFLNDRIDLVGRAHVERHIAVCASCHQRLAELERVSTVTSRPAATPDVDLLATRTAGGRSDEDGILPVGAQVGRYVVLAMEGKGGMGVVYAAEDPELQRKVAIKLLRRAPLEDEGDTALLEERLRREGQALAQLSHPNVVAIYDVGTYDDRIFIAMEYVEGSTLAHWLRSEPRPWREVLDRFVAAGRGLAAAHAADLVHRDFKPENVLLGNDGRPRVADFGLARSAALPPLPSVDWASPFRPDDPIGRGLTATGEMVGTPFYMAPEQYRAEATDARSDQFSFCVALYRGLFRQLPFEGDTLDAFADSMQKGEVREPPAGTRVPARIRRAIARGLSADPAERLPSMEALLDALDHKPRRGWLLAVSAALLLTAGGVFGGKLLAHDQELCRGSENRLRGVWDAGRKASVEMALRRSGGPFAEATVKEVGRRLDAYAASWVVMDTEACRATRVEGRQTEEQLGLRTMCLDERLHELTAMVDRLVEADRHLAANAVTFLRDLAGLAMCADVKTLARPIQPPSDPAVRERVDALNAELARARSLGRAAKLDPALEAASKLLPEASRIGYRPLEAKANLVVAEIREARLDVAQARKSYEDALWAAEAGRDDPTAVSALIGLMNVVGRMQTQYDRVPEYRSRATAALERMGGDPEHQAFLHRRAGIILTDQGKLDEAEREFSQALAIAEKRVGPDDLEVVDALHGLGLIADHRGKREESLKIGERILAIETRVRGPDHPALAPAHRQIAAAKSGMGKYAEAEASCRRALAIDERAGLLDHPEMSSSLRCVAKTLPYLGKSPEAVTLMRRAAAIDEKIFGPNHPRTGEALIDLGWALSWVDQPKEMLSVLERAKSLFTTLFKGDHPRLAYILKAIAMADLNLDRGDAALEAAIQSDAMSRRMAGDNYPGEGDTLRMIGAAYLVKEQPAKAIDPLTRSCAIYRKGSNQTYYYRSSAFLARALYDSGRDRARGRALARETLQHWRAEGEQTDSDMKELESWMRRRRLLTSRRHTR